MDQQGEPFITVAMPVHNGAATIGRALDSLLAQDYPPDRYEVIVVNDGSTDDTARVVAERAVVRYVELPHNQGIPSALNAGLAAAKGEIYATFDDDCLASPDYLMQLALGYQRLDSPLGVGGVMVKHASGKVVGLTSNYVDATRSINRRVDEDAPALTPSIAKRFLIYLGANYISEPDQEQDNYPPVVELYGSNASFPVAKLRQVGGWDVSMSAPAVGGIEDRDTCYRLRQLFPGHRFYVARQAHLRLDQDPEDAAVSFKSYMLRPYRRGRFNYVFHVKNGITPPLFPFPILTLLILLADVGVAASGFAVAALLLPLLIVFLPQLCYGWWVKRAVEQRRPMFLLFPYLQTAEETMVLAGLVRGYLIAKRTPSAPQVTSEDLSDRQQKENSAR